MWDSSSTGAKKIPYFLYNWLTDGGEAVSLWRRPALPAPNEDIWYLISFRGYMHLRAIARLEGLGKLKTKIH
jgi:hypothetical protein